MLHGVSSVASAYCCFRSVSVVCSFSVELVSCTARPTNVLWILSDLRAFVPVGVVVVVPQRNSSCSTSVLLVSALAITILSRRRSGTSGYYIRSDSSLRLLRVCWRCSGYLLRIATNSFTCLGESLLMVCAAKIDVKSVCSIAPRVMATRYRTSRAYSPRTGTASTRKCRFLLFG